MTRSRADSQLISWLLHESGVSRYKISKDTGITESTLSRLVHGQTHIKNMQFGYAVHLTEYARNLKSENKRKINTDIKRGD